jgi:hypothetical protein
MGTAYIAKELHHGHHRAARRCWPAPPPPPGLLGSVNIFGTFAFTPVLGRGADAGGRHLLLRLLPQGITGRFFRRAL